MCETLAGNFSLTLLEFRVMVRSRPWRDGDDSDTTYIDYTRKEHSRIHDNKGKRSLRPSGRSAHGHFKLLKVLARVQLHPRLSPRLVVLPLVGFTRPVVPRQIRRPRLDRRAKLALPHQHSKVPRKVARIVSPLGALQAPPPVPLVGDPLACDRVVRRGGILGQVPVFLQHPLDGPCPVAEDADGFVAPRDLASKGFSDSSFRLRCGVVRGGLFNSSFGAPSAPNRRVLRVMRFWGMGKWWLLR